MKKVALTSSTGSVYVNYGTVPAEHVYTCDDWSPAELLREKQNWYCSLAPQMIKLIVFRGMRNM